MNREPAKSAGWVFLMCADFPRGFFPDWWDIHTHKANHRTRLLSYRIPFGNGRSMTADWGRVGSCQLTLSDDAVHVRFELLLLMCIVWLLIFSHRGQNECYASFSSIYN